MVRTTLSPWLGAFISTEVTQVINWKNSQNENIKPDPDSRFTDDGSNFRSLVTHLPLVCSLQLIEVLSIKDHPTVIVSDGQTRVKARLSEATVAALEEEADSQFDFDTTNDVFQPKTVTVISTPFGTPDGFIQLYIDGIEYEHHLRRGEGQPLLIEENETIRNLLDDIKRIREAGLPAAESLEYDRAQTQEPSFDSQRPLPSERAAQHSRTPTWAMPKGSQSTNETQPTRTVFETQRVVQRKPTGPNLARDGFEVEAGLNLERPLQAASNDAPITNVSAGSTSNHADSDKLLGLFGAMRGEKRPREALRPVEQSPVVVPETPVRHSDGNPDARDANSALPATDRPVPLGAAPHSAQLPSHEPEASLRSSGRPSVPYGRRKIPAIQRNLLDRKDCWLPSLPGQAFPAPSVPIELLTRWNITSRQAPKDPMASHNEHEVEQGKPMEVRPKSPAKESELCSDSDDHQLPWSSSPPRGPPSSPPRSPELPPDSSFERVVRGTQQDDLEVAPPRAFPTRRSRPRPEHSSPPNSFATSSERHDRPQNGTPRRSPYARRSPALAAEVSRPVRSQHFEGSQTRYNHTSRPSHFDRPRPRGGSWRPSSRGSGRTWEYDQPPRPGSAWSGSYDRRPSPPVRAERQFSGTRRSFDGTADDTRSRGPPSPGSRLLALDGNAISPPTAPRVMRDTFSAQRSRPMSGQANMDPNQSSPINSPSQPDHVSRAQPSVAESPRSSPWRNLPMVGRRQSGLTQPSPKNITATANRPQVNGLPHSPAMRLSPAPSQSLTQVAPTDPDPRVAATQYHPSPHPYHDGMASGQPDSLQHPDDSYRDVRREHMQQYERQRWLQGNFILDPSGIDTFDTVLHAYMLYHTPGEGREGRSLTEQSFSLAFQSAFFCDESTSPRQMRFTPKNYLKRVFKGKGAQKRALERFEAAIQNFQEQKVEATRVLCKTSGERKLERKGTRRERKMLEEARLLAEQDDARARQDSPKKMTDSDSTAERLPEKKSEEELKRERKERRKARKKAKRRRREVLERQLQAQEDSASEWEPSDTDSSDSS